MTAIVDKGVGGGKMPIHKMWLIYRMKKKENIKKKK